MSGQSPTGVQTPGQRVLVNVLPLFLIFFLILTGHVSSGFEFTAHFDPALFLVPVFFLALYGQRTMTPVIIMVLGLFQGYCRRHADRFLGFAHHLLLFRRARPAASLGAGQFPRAMAGLFRHLFADFSGRLSHCCGAR